MTLAEGFWELHGVRLASSCYLCGKSGSGRFVFLLANPLAQWQAEQLPVEAEPGPSSRQSTEAFRSISSFLELQRAWFPLGNLVHYLLVVSSLAVLLPVSGCCLWECVLDFSGGPGMLLVRNSWFGSGHPFRNSARRPRTNGTLFSTAKWTRILKWFSPLS